MLIGIFLDEATLKRRHIMESDRCNVCFAMEEDLSMHSIAHMQNGFGMKLRVGSSSGYQDCILTRGLAIFYVIPGSMIGGEQKLSMLCEIWTPRNRCTHDEEKLDPAALV